jgi:hypothetical protein
MDNLKNKELLDVPEVVEEIKRHLWIESEKAGYDVGFDKAAEDWLNRFSDAWIQYHSAKKQTKKTGDNGASNKNRRAKSYFF